MCVCLGWFTQNSAKIRESKNSVLNLSCYFDFAWSKDFIEQNPILCAGGRVLAQKCDLFLIAHALSHKLDFGVCGILARMNLLRM